MTSHSNPTLLAGIRVLDLADERGEMCGRFLADLGADVLRVETPSGETTRKLPPLVGELSASFAWRNANKRGLTLDTTSKTGGMLLERLLKTSDVLLSSVRHSMNDIEEITSRHPHLVVATISDFGLGGPYGSYEGNELIDFALGGSMKRFGPAEKAPLIPPGAFAYDIAGVHAALYTVMSLLARIRSKRGGHLDISVVESVANTADWSIPAGSRSTVAVQRAGASVYYPIFPCADGHIRMVIPLLPRQWLGLKKWLGEPSELAGDHWNDVQVRLGNEILNDILRGFFASKSRVQLAHEAQRHGVPLTPVLLPTEVMTNEHALARGTFAKFEIQSGHDGTVATGSFEIDGQRIGYRKRAPSLGEHNNEIYCDELGLTPDELTALRTGGIL